MEFAFGSRRGLVGSVLAYYTKSQGSSPRPDIKTKYEKYFFGDFLLRRFLAKALRVNKIAMKSFSKKIFHLESSLNSGSRHL